MLSPGQRALTLPVFRGATEKVQGARLVPGPRVRGVRAYRSERELTASATGDDNGQE